jgi:hypothetical protein
MSVIDFIAVRSSKDENASQAAGAFSAASALDNGKVDNGALSASQFTRHVSHIVEDEMKRALKRHVDVIDPHEMIAMAKVIADLKSRYLAMGLMVASNKTPMTDSELEDMRSLRMRIQEMEAAHNEINEAIMAHLVDVKGVMKE